MRLRGMLRRHYLLDEWRDAFVTELRLREVPGPQIGDALAEVEAHCADSGQKPAAAFGDPVSYAATRAVDLGKLPPRRQTSLLRAASMATASCCGTLGVLSGADAVVHHIPAEVTLGAVVLITLAPATVAAAVALVLRPGLRHRQVWLAATTAVFVTAPLIPLVLLHQVVLHVPGPAMLATGVVLLVAAWWQLVSGRRVADRVVDPRSGREPFSVPTWVMIAVRFGPIAFLGVIVLVIVLAPAPH